MKSISKWLNNYSFFIYFGFGVIFGIVLTISFPSFLVLFCLSWSMFTTVILIALQIKLNDVYRDLVESEKENEVLDKAKFIMKKKMVQYAIKSGVAPDDYLHMINENIEQIKEKARREIEKND